ncbi:FAD-dependent oxidoreductase (plasmid) [Methylocystis sp. MJC1]|jgi:nitrite reductase (NADH) large subunit|uniref:NAD(P)/FAD-dependent oxidoreductase n=1 Tax=Methylocystis sp. MJC1 TaxID=2654282 RepID=UPI0013ECFC43|nr:FAD-dependent oxidoreductase [Methylocystis sp. MJC1]KAF2989088.1 Nitrite reductase [NAD(P)H] [Methylocystis sp. MJC1]MBU6529133.1 NAD(P)/FAD-dependent oxidoreductase [Methylocystis sp. MJC1]UZX14067.1 FAD-dependent oxidoreductase [Methylocystis sp. MJC1]
MEKETLVIVGAGMAATRLVDELIAAAPGRYAIHVIGEEPRLAYNRVLLSSALTGEVRLDDIVLKPREWWRANGVEITTGQKAVRLDTASRVLVLEDGERIAYSKLVLATGSRAMRLPIEGADLPGVHTFRDMQDVEALARLGAKGASVLVIGGGLLGLEAAYGLVKRGARVTLAHVMDRLMERQLDQAGAAILHRMVEEKGVRVMLRANASHIRGDGCVERVEFEDGRSLPADAVVFAVGVRPNVELAKAGGLAVNRGVVVDDGLATSDANVFAIGECVEHRGQCYGLVEPAYEHARVLAARLAGADAVYHGSLVATNLKVSGVRVFSAGDFIAGEGLCEIVCKDPRLGVYRKLVIEGDCLKGAVLIGDTSSASAYLDLIRTGNNIATIRDELVFEAPQLREAA